MTFASSESAIRFDDGDAYERFMGPWSRAAGTLFLEWLNPLPQARWLEVGCGTGSFTQLIHEKCVPAAIVAVDPAPAQIAYARSQLSLAGVEFRVAAAEAVPCRDATCDFVVAALALNFFNDRAAAIREMRRVASSGGMIAGYVWDFLGGGSPHAPVSLALRRIGIDAPAPPGGDECGLLALQSLFASGGLIDVETTTLHIEVNFSDFSAFWKIQTPSFSPTTRLIASLDKDDRRRLMDGLRALLPHGPDGIVCRARANAVRGRTPRTRRALP